MTPALHSLVQLGAERLLNSIPEGIAISALAWVLLQFTGKQNSGTRFAVWFAALLAIGVMPFFQWSVGGSTTPGAAAKISLSETWAVVFAGVWLLFAVFSGARLAVAFFQLHSLRRAAEVLDPSEIAPGLREVLKHTPSSRRVMICSSSAVRVPMAIGFFKPAILIPKWALCDLSAEELKVILLHEFAHIRRWDDWTNLAQKIVRTVFFFHPAVWWIERRLSLEREMACDDAVLAETRNPQGYAASLVSLAEKSFVRRGIAMAQAAISRAHETSIRLAQILDGKRPQGTRVFKPIIGLTVASAVLCFMAMPYSPRLIAFDSGPRTGVVAAETSAHHAVAPARAGRISNEVALPNGVSVVPASFVSTESTTVGLKAVAASHRSAIVRATSTTSKVTQQKRVITPAPVLVRTTMNSDAQLMQFFLVMQTTEFDGQGWTRSSISVWQLTFTPVEQNEAPATVVVKVI